MWEEEDEDDIIIPGSQKADELIESFLKWELGTARFFTEIELEFLFKHFQYYAPDNISKVQKIIELGLDNYPNSGTFQLCKAQYLIDREEYDEALNFLSIAKLLDPMNIEIHILMSDCYEEKGDFLQSYEILLEAESFTEEYNSELQTKIAWLLIHFGKTEKGIVKISEIIQQECKNDNHSFITSIHFDSDLVLKAIDILIDKEPFNYDYWFFKGHNALIYMNDIETAIEAFEYAHYINEKAPEPLFHLGICHKENKHFNTAKRYFGEAAEYGYNKQECILEASICMNRLGDYAQARFMLQNLLNHNEINQFEVYYEIGYSYLQQGEINKSIPYIEQSVELNPTLDGYILLGEIAFKQNDIDNLVDCFNAAKQLMMTDYELFICRFFGMFYQLEELTNMYEVLVLNKTNSQELESDLLTNLLSALISKTEGKNVQYIQNMLYCFASDSELTIEYMEMIDSSLVYDPDIVNLKELF